MTALAEGAAAPAQFAFDHGAMGATPGIFAFVISGARHWVEAGLDATGEAVLQQARDAFAAGTWPTPPTLLRVLCEKRFARDGKGFYHPTLTYPPTRQSERENESCLCCHDGCRWYRYGRPCPG